MLSTEIPSTILGIPMGKWRCNADTSPYRFRVGHDSTRSVEVKHLMWHGCHELTVKWSNSWHAGVSTGSHQTMEEALSSLRRRLVQRGHVVFSHLT